jgi:hypothetical protein
MRELFSVATTKRQSRPTVVFICETHHAKFVTKIDRGIVRSIVITLRSLIVVVAHWRPP